MGDLILRKRVAKMLGWKNLHLAPNATGGSVLVGKRPGRSSRDTMVPQFEEQDCYAIEVERFILKFGPIFVYRMCLNAQVKNCPIEFVARLATPEQRCVAALEAMKKE